MDWTIYHQEFCRKSLFVSGVYCFFNSGSKRVYVGESDNIGVRVMTHVRHIINMNHHVKLVNQDVEEYGSDLFRFRILRKEKTNRFALEKKFTQYIQDASQFQLYSDHHITDGLSKSPFTEDRIKEVMRLKNSNKSYNEITKICNEKWGYNYSWGKYYSIYHRKFSAAELKNLDETTHEQKT